MTTKTLPADTVTLLNDLFTHSYYSAAGYVFEAQPYFVPEDTALMDRLRDVRLDDRRHATLLANLIQLYDRVPEPGAFPYWYRDLNYLTVPYMAGFVAESLAKDVARYDAAMDTVPEDLRLVHTTLRTIRKDRAERLEILEPLVAEACEREARRYTEDIATLKKERAARVAREKAEAEAARRAKAGAAADGIGDPDEPGISNRERGRRVVLRGRIARGEMAAPGGALADPTAGLPDPNEPGISNKEKAKRTMMIKRAKATGLTAAPAAADPAAGLPDPNEPGISNKEKAKRTMMIKRARAKGAAAAPAPAAAPSTGSGTDVDPLMGMPDPDEPGISNKEKAKRTMMIKRAQKKASAPEPADGAAEGGAAPAAAPAPAADDPLMGLPDPNEAGISNKEKAKRTMMLKRAQKKASAPGPADGAAEGG